MKPRMRSSFSGPASTVRLSTGGLSFSIDESQKLLPSQLSLFNYVHDRGLVYLFMKRYNGASAIDMSQENVTALLSDRDEAYLSQGFNDFFS